MLRLQGDELIHLILTVILVQAKYLFDICQRGLFVFLHTTRQRRVD